jgi:hypothetical protein
MKLDDIMFFAVTSAVVVTLVFLAIFISRATTKLGYEVEIFEEAKCRDLGFIKRGGK